MTVVDEWAADGGDVVDGDEDDTVIVGSAGQGGVVREGREGKRHRFIFDDVPCFSMFSRMRHNIT